MTFWLLKTQNFFYALGLSLLLLGTGAFAQGKVVYHIDDAKTQATKGLRNIRNQLNVAPDTKVTVVAHANGVDFLFDGATDPKNPNIDYASLVAGLTARGVLFEVCEITLKNRKIDKNRFNLDTNFTPSGVVRITQLQNEDGYAYMKP